MIISDDIAVVAAPDLVERIQQELGGRQCCLITPNDDSRTTLSTAIIATPDWEDTVGWVRARWPECELVVVCSEPEGARAQQALRSSAIAAIVQIHWRPGELAAAFHVACRFSQLKRAGLASLDALNAVVAAINSAQSQADILHRATSRLGDLMDVDIAAALVHPADGNPLLHLHSAKENDEGLARATRDLCLSLLAEKTARSVSTQQLVIETSGKPLCSHGFVDRPRCQAYAIIRTNDRPVGILFASAKTGTGYSNHTRRNLEFVAQHTAIALERLSGSDAPRDRVFRQLFEWMPDGVVFADLNTDDVILNSAARTLLGIPPHDLVNRRYLKECLGFYPFDLIPSGSRTQAPLREELTIGRKELHSMITGVRNPDGALMGVLVALRDFTHNKVAARKQEEFVTELSHKLRTPLTSIAGSLEIAMSSYAGSLNERQRQFVQLAKASCQALNVLVDDMLDVSPVEHEAITLNVEPLTLDSLTRDVVNRYRSRAEKKGVNLIFECDDDNIAIVGDAERLTQVLNNLVSNAIKFARDDGTTEVQVFGTSIASNHVGVSVFNDGVPVPEDVRDHIFDSFDPVRDRAIRKIGGSGLGLAISRAIVEAHGGRIWIESRPIGTEFIFTLPAALNPGDVKGNVAAQTPSLSLKQKPLEGVLVLLIDHEQHSRYILKGILMAAGYEVAVAGDHDEAIAVARSKRPTLAIVRHGDDHLDSAALVEILKHDPDTHRVAVLVLAEEQERPVFIRAGADETLPLPVQPEALRHACATLVADASATPNNRILVVDDDIAIRTICREVFVRSGFSCREAPNGLAALSEARRFRPDLILLDINMPDLDGFQAAEQLKADPSTSLTPLIFLSARGETEDKVKAFRIGAEDYVVKPFVAAELVARVRKALERRNRELDASPTTQLPGAGAIETEIVRRLGQEGMAFCYLDLDNLKAFNDYYGYAKADAVIRQTGDLIRDVIQRLGDNADFIGHIAGDDFVFITSTERVDTVCVSICSAFDRLVPLYYNKSDRESGFIETKDRYGELRRFPIMSASLAAITDSSLRRYSELAAAAAAGKKLAKAIPGSSYVRDGTCIHPISINDAPTTVEPATNGENTAQTKKAAL